MVVNALKESNGRGSNPSMCNSETFQKISSIFGFHLAILSIINDGELVYSNLFDTSVDAFVSAMEREGVVGVPVVVSGWPTGRGEAASVENSRAYNAEVVRRAVEGVRTPRRPGVGVEVFLFNLFDENEKYGEEFERHFGIFGLDGLKDYDLNFN
ncbi:hypothetical protein ACFX12_021266 [Malus domestica]